jgi:hypothetical protein
MNRTASTSASLGSWGADATRPRRLKFYDITFGSEATPADAAILWVAQRCTALGTVTAVTPKPLDPADAATESDAGENATAEPTYTSGEVMLSIALNQRASFRWVAAPGGEIVTPATASNGLGLKTPTISTGTPVITATIHAEEQ